MAGDNNEIGASKAAVPIVAGLATAGVLLAALFGGKKKPASGMAGPQPPKLRKGCNCGR